MIRESKYSELSPIVNITSLLRDTTTRTDDHSWSLALLLQRNQNELKDVSLSDLNSSQTPLSRTHIIIHFKQPARTHPSVIKTEYQEETSSHELRVEKSTITSITLCGGKVTKDFDMTTKQTHTYQINNNLLVTH